MAKNCIVQIYVNGEVPEFDARRRNPSLVDASTYMFKNYAQAIGADYFLFTQPVWPQYHPQMEIFRVLELNDYDHVLTVDADIVINKPVDIFPHAHPTGLTACHRPLPGNINSGVIVWGREAREYYKTAVDMERGDASKNRDQDEINRISEDYPAHLISWKFNDYTFNPESYWHHYKGGLKKNWRT